MLNSPLKTTWFTFLVVLSQSVEPATTGTSEAAPADTGGLHPPGDDSSGTAAGGSVPNLLGGEHHHQQQQQQNQQQQAAMNQRDSDDSGQKSASSVSPSGLTRLSFSDLHRASANSYTSSCCHAVPELCTPAGRCALNTTDCVSFCICARSPELRWCPGELRRLRRVLAERPEKGPHRQRGDEGGHGEVGGGAGGGIPGLPSGVITGGIPGLSPLVGAGAGAGGIPGLAGGAGSIPGLSPGGSRSSLSLSDLGLGNALHGASLGSLHLPGRHPPPASSPSEDGVQLQPPSPARLASSLGDVVTGDASDDALSGDGAGAGGGLGDIPHHHPLPALSPMMVNDGGVGGEGGGGEGDSAGGAGKSSEETTWRGGDISRGNGSRQGAGGFLTSLDVDKNKNLTTHINNNEDLQSKDNSSTIITINNNDSVSSINNNNNNNNDLTPQIIIPWWPTNDEHDHGDNDGGENDLGGGHSSSSSSDPCSGSGSACILSGGRCVFDFNTTYSQVCVYDSVDPCQTMSCVHGTCVTRNGSHSCACHPGWAGTLCSRKCELDCGPYGTCVVMKGKPACRCQSNYTGVLCDDLKPTPSPWTGVYLSEDTSMTWKIAAGCVGLTAVLLMLTLLVGYVTWRRQWIPVRKLIYNFQHYEEDDGKEYDAFVSYRSASRDEEFVLHELYPQLERHLDFKLCMHFRDFAPGETIADNIIQAIESSRRTILVLSPAYVQSEWCRLEYQKAQHEMLKLRHKIIPVVLEEVSHVKSVDRNLQTILDTVTYIRWPGNGDSKSADKFWKLLRLSMPKKRKPGGSDYYSRSLSSTGSCASDRPLTTVSGSCFGSVVNDMTSPSASSVAASASASAGSRGLYPQRSLSITSSFDVEEEAEEEEEGVYEEEEVEVVAATAERDRVILGEKETPLQVVKMMTVVENRRVKSKSVGRYYAGGDAFSESDNDNGSGDSGCPRDRASSSESEEGEGRAGNGGGGGGGDPSCLPLAADDAAAKLPPSRLPVRPPPPSPRRSPVISSGIGGGGGSESHHVTSDDHIVEIRELPVGGQVKVTPWVPARFYPNV